MANTTVRGALSIHGTNPQYLVEKVIRSRIYESGYWKEHCFALNSASLIDNALSLTHIGGTYANTRPTEFMCLVLKLLQLQPEREIILEYLRAEEFKYLRALAAFYVRLTFDPVNVYEVLEPLLDDYRKLRVRAMDGSYSLTTIDEFADQLLTEERVCEIILPRLTQRRVLEETEGLAPRRSRLGRAMGVLGAPKSDAGGSDGEGGSGSERGERFMSRSPSRSVSPEVQFKREESFYTEGSEEESEGEGGRTARGRSRSRSGSGSVAGSGGRYVSRSPSAGSEAGGARFVSRSPEGSPEPVDAQREGMEVDV